MTQKEFESLRTDDLVICRAEGCDAYNYICAIKKIERENIFYQGLRPQPNAKIKSCGVDHCDEYHYSLLEIYNQKPKQTLMNKLSLMMKKLLDSDLQTLVKAGYIDGNLELTAEGKTALDSVLFDNYKSDLVVLAQEKIVEEKENK